MENLANYSGYDVHDFITDSSFRAWILNPTPKLHRFWKDFQRNNPDKAVIMDQAGKLLLAIKFKEELPSDILVEESLKKALLTISYSHKNAPVISIFRRWWAVAAILLIALPGVIYFLASSGKKIIPISKSPQPVSIDLAPGGNKAVLTLSDGSTINLDSAQKGVISSQQGFDVIKLANGQIAYANKGQDKPVEIVYNTIATPKGGQYQVILPDGSKVWLNAASSITFPTGFTALERSVTITGEVYFEVAHESTRPFHVHSGEMEIEVLGTFFNVNAYKDEPYIRTTLLQGAVKIKKGKKDLLMQPGEQAVLSKDGQDIRLAGKVNIEEVMAWKNGKFIFEEASLQTIIRTLKRWYDIEQVIQEGKETEDEYVGVISRNVPLSTILNMLEKTGTARFEIKGKTIIIK